MGRLWPRLLVVAVVLSIHIAVLIDVFGSQSGNWSPRLEADVFTAAEIIERDEGINIVRTSGNAAADAAAIAYALELHWVPGTNGGSPKMMRVNFPVTLVSPPGTPRRLNLPALFCADQLHVCADGRPDVGVRNQVTACAAQLAQIAHVPSAGYLISQWCGSDPLATQLNPASWTALMGGASDGTVPLASQFDGNVSYSTSANTVVAVHSAGAESLGFTPPLILDQASGAPIVEP